MPGLPPPTNSLDENLQITTPEQVTLELPVAGFAMRIVALGLDSLLLGLIALAVFFSGLTLFGAGSDLSQAMSIALTSGIMMGYFFLCEYFMQGRTPGKAACGLRVVTTAGDVPTVTQFLIRNLLRPADLLLSALGIELFLVFWSPRSQRLGDMAAGTLVVRDAAVRLVDVERSMARHQFLAAAQTQSLAGGAAGWVRRADTSDIELLRRYMARRGELDQAQRHELAHRIAAHFEQKFGAGLVHAGLSDEEKVARYWEDVMRGTGGR